MDAKVNNRLNFWTPGCAFNHSHTKDNIITVKTNIGYDLVTTKDMQPGDEILCNYSPYEYLFENTRLFFLMQQLKFSNTLYLTYGNPPVWFAQFANENGIIAAFPGLNDFV